MSVVPPLSGPPLYRYIPGVGRAVAVETNVSKYSTFGGGVLVVDQAYGNDTLATADPFNRPFLTLAAAVARATSGMCIYLMPGAYQGPITIPTGVAIRGISTQVVSINALDMTSNTTLVTMGTQTRLEDVTLNLSSSFNTDLIGVDFPSGTPQTAKLRTMVINVTSTATGLCNVKGIRSAGSGSLAVSSSIAIRASTVNVTASGTGSNRGVLVSSDNRFVIRDCNVFAMGAGANNVGVETTHASAICRIISTSVAGDSSNVDQTLHHDINRTLGSIVLSGETDLLNNDANGNSFSTTAEPSNLLFGMIGNPADSRRYYLVPGVVPIGNVPDTSPATWTVGNLFPIPWNQPVIVFTFTLNFTGTITLGATMTFNIHKNSAAAPVLSIVLSAGETTKTVTTQSAVFATGDTMSCTLVTANPDGSIGSGTFVGIVGTY